MTLQYLVIFHQFSRLCIYWNGTVSISFFQSWLIRNALPGRLVCDTRVSARELVRSRTYNLSDLAHQILANVRCGNRGSASAQRQIPVPITQRLCGGSTSSKVPVSDSDVVHAVGVELADLEIDSFDLRCLFVTSDLVRQLIDFCLSDAHLVLRLAHQLQVTSSVPPFSQFPRLFFIFI